MNCVLALLVASMLGVNEIQAPRETLTNDDVSTSALIQLKSKKLPDEVIQAMVEASSSSEVRPAAAVAAEIRLFMLRAADGGNSVRTPIEGATARQRFAVGLFSVGSQVVLPGKNAAIQSPEARPAFEFEFVDDGDTPSRYLLARFEESDEGGGRKLDLRTPFNSLQRRLARASSA